MAAPRYITQQICSPAQLAAGVLLHATVAVFATHVPPAASHVAAPPVGAGAPVQIAFGGFDFCRLQASVEQPASRQAASFSAKQHSPLLVSTMYWHEVASARAVPPTPHSDTAASPTGGSSDAPAGSVGVDGSAAVPPAGAGVVEATG